MKYQNTDSITKALGGQPTPAECDEMIAACGTLVAEGRARLEELRKLPGLAFKQQSTIYQAAVLEGIDIDDERRKLKAHIDRADDLGFACLDAKERALDAAAKRDIPKSARAMRRLARDLSEKLAALEDAAAAFNKQTEIVSEFSRLPDGRLPFDDNQLAALLEIRNKLWCPVLLSVPHNLGPDPNSELAREYRKSWPLLYVIRGAADQTIATRRPPENERTFMPNFSNEPVIRTYTGRQRARRTGPVP